MRAEPGQRLLMQELVWERPVSDYSHIVIAFDVDGVILDYVRGFMEWSARKGVRLGCEPHEVTDWSMQNAFPDLDGDGIWANIEAFSTHPDFGGLLPFEGAFEAIAALHREFPGVSIVAITSASKKETLEITKGLRLANLSTLPFDEIHVLELGSDKSAHLAQLPPGSAFIDDLKKNVVAAEKVGLNAILYRQSYNVSDTHHRVATNWAELEAHVREIVAATPFPAKAKALGM